MVSGDRDAAFTASYPHLFSVAYRTAYRMCGEREVAEELAQEALIRAYTRWNRLRDTKEGWIVTTTMRLAIDRWRRDRRRDTDQAREAVTPPDAAAAQRIDLVALLATLPRRQREVLVLRYLEDQSERDVARILGCSVGAVKRHAHRASAAMRAIMEPPPGAVAEVR